MYASIRGSFVPIASLLDKDWMQDARTRPVFRVNGSHAAPDHRINALDKFCFDLNK
jgi:hypothetical protein